MHHHSHCVSCGPAEMIVSGVSLLFGTALHLDHRGVVVVVLLVDHLQLEKQSEIVVIVHRTNRQSVLAVLAGTGNLLGRVLLPKDEGRTVVDDIMRYYEIRDSKIDTPADSQEVTAGGDHCNSEF